MRYAALLFLAPLAVACAAPEPDLQRIGSLARARTKTSAVASASTASPTVAAPVPVKPCPDDMVYVDTTYCDDLERECLDLEHEEPNHLKICHRFKEGKQHCTGTEERRRFCIDTYEYPNQKGAHPIWMLTWYEAQATCRSKGKRLCWQSEWTAACEGPSPRPFPYGWVRDHAKCNMDNGYIEPENGPWGGFKFYSTDKRLQFAELSRLDQSAPSGALDECKSGFGVYDQPGNVDEWVISDEPPQHKSRWAALKGGAWGHVRSACRPTTYSHEPEFSYYFVSFRCCNDAAGAPVWQPSRPHTPAPVVEAHDYAQVPIVPLNPPGPSKEKVGRRDRARKQVLDASPEVPEALDGGSPPPLEEAQK